MSRSQITAEVDFGAPGKQTGFLRVPPSVHRSAHGWIPVPVAVIARLMLAGVQGDEYEGRIALTRLVQELAPA